MLDCALEKDCSVVEESNPCLSEDSDDVATLPDGYTWIIHLSRSFTLHA